MDLATQAQAQASRLETHRHRIVAILRELGSLQYSEDINMVSQPLVAEALILVRDEAALTSSGHTDGLSPQFRLAHSFIHLYQQNRNVCILRGAIDLQREALSGLPDGDSMFDQHLKHLIMSLQALMQHGFNMEILLEVVNLQRIRVASLPRDAQARVEYCSNLSKSLIACYNHAGDQRFLDEALDLLRQVLTLLPEDHTNRMACYANIASLLQLKYQHNKDVTILLENIDFQQKLLDLLPLKHPHHQHHLMTLVSLLKTNFQLTGEKTSLNHAIALARTGVALQRAEQPHGEAHAAYNGVLANLLQRLYESDHDENALKDAIDLENEALDFLPNDHSEYAKHYANLGNSLRLRFDTTKDDWFLAEAADLQRKAVILHAEKHNAPGRLMRENLAITLSKQYNHTRDVHFLLEMVRLRWELHEETYPNEDLDRAEGFLDLAEVLHIAYHEADANARNNILMDAIELERLALASYPPKVAFRVAICQLLASSLQTCFGNNEQETSCLTELLDLELEILERLELEGCLTSLQQHTRHCLKLTDAISFRLEYIDTQDVSIFPQVIRLHRTVLTARERRQFDNKVGRERLALMLWRYHQRRGNEVLLLEAIKLQRATAALQVDGKHDPQISCNLAMFLGTHFEITGDLKTLYEALDIQRKVLDMSEVADDQTQKWIATKGQISLANLLKIYYAHTGDDAALTEAIGVLREGYAASIKAELDPSLRAICCSNLADTISTRYSRTGDEYLLQEAISLQREALHISMQEDSTVDAAPISLRLGSLLKERYLHTRDHQVLIDALELSRRAASLKPARTADRAAYVGNLSGMLELSYDTTGDKSVLLECIDLAREALALTAIDGSLGGWTIALGNLASTLQTYCEESGDTSHVSEISSLCQEALAHPYLPRHRLWRIACVLSWTYIHRDNPSYSVMEAITCISRAIVQTQFDDIHTAVRLMLQCLDNIRKSFELYPDRGGLQNYHAALTPIYRQLVEFILPLLANPALEIQAQTQALKSTSRIGSEAFVNEALQQHGPTALEFLESAQGILWSQRVRFRQPQLERVPPSLAAELDAHLRQFAAPRSLDIGSVQQVDSALTHRDVLHDHSIRINSVLHKIRAIPGLERFMLAETYVTLKGAASEHPVIVLAGAHDRSYALVIAPSHMRPRADTPLLELPIAHAEVESLFVGSLHTTHRGVPNANEEIKEHYTRAMTLASRRKTPLYVQLMRLWQAIVKPVIDYLGLQRSKGRDRPRLHWCTTGLFASLPVHAAGIYDGPVTDRVCCADYVVSSYTPTVTALLRSQNAATRIPTKELTFALVAEKRAQDRNLQSIPGVDEEVKEIGVSAELRKVQSIQSLIGNTTLSSASTAMSTASVIHLACHGVQDALNATQSGFCLGDGRLTISQLMELELQNPFLAFLSACETAKGDQEQPDLTIHLAAAMLFAGYQSVVATMWAISDTDGPFVAKRFYEALLEEDFVYPDSVAYSLASAVESLQHEGAGPERWIPFIHLGA